MTVAELIAKLQTMPPDAVVLTPGFDESGLSPAGVELCDVFQFPDGDRYRDRDDRSLVKQIGALLYVEESAPTKIKAVVVNFSD